MPNSLEQNHGKCISHLKGEFLIEILGLKGINGINVAKLGVDSLVFWARAVWVCCTKEITSGKVRVWNFLVQRNFIP